MTQLCSVCRSALNSDWSIARHNTRVALDGERAYVPTVHTLRSGVVAAAADPTSRSTVSDAA